MLKTKDILPKLNEVSSKLFNCNISELTEKQLYTVMCTLLKELLAQKRKKFKDEISPKNKKQVYYMSMEFLVGTSLRNNLYNLGLEGEFRHVLKKEGFNILINYFYPNKTSEINITQKPTSKE